MSETFSRPMSEALRLRAHFEWIIETLKRPANLTVDATAEEVAAAAAAFETADFLLKGHAVKIWDTSEPFEAAWTHRRNVAIVTWARENGSDVMTWMQAISQVAPDVWTKTHSVKAKIELAETLNTQAAIHIKQLLRIPDGVAEMPRQYEGRSPSDVLPEVVEELKAAGPFAEHPVVADSCSRLAQHEQGGQALA